MEPKPSLLRLDASGTSEPGGTASSGALIQDTGESQDVIDGSAGVGADEAADEPASEGAAPEGLQFVERGGAPPRRHGQGTPSSTPECGTPSAISSCRTRGLWARSLLARELDDDSRAYKSTSREVRAPSDRIDELERAHVADHGLDLLMCHACADGGAGPFEASSPSTLGGVSGEAVETSTGRAVLPKLADRVVPPHEAEGGKPALNVIGHVRFLQHLFRRARTIRPGCWRAGGLAALAVFRPVRHPLCRHGSALSPPSAFPSQAERWRRGLAWYKQHTLLLKKFQSGRTPLVLDLFCSAGGASAGAIRAGASVIGVDSTAQPSFTARFGGESFVLGDATEMERLRGLVRRLDPILIWASPPCAPYSSVPNLGEASNGEQLIGVMRSVLQTLGRPYVIENVQGARHALLEPFELHGQLFGLRQDRLRLFETGGGFTLAAEEGLFASGRALRQGSCLGRRRRFPRNDPFGRRIETSGRAVCCEGNIWATQGSSPHYGTLVDHAASMGIDAGHMTYAELAQAVPPDYSSFIVGQAAMHWLSVHYGVESVSLDQLEAGPAEAQATMRHLLRGAGGTSATAGLKFVRASSRASIEVGSQLSESVECPSALVWEEDATRTSVPLTPSSEVDASHQVSRARWGFEEHVLGRLCRPSSGVSSTAWSLTESDFRELDYTHAGD